MSALGVTRLGSGALAGDWDRTPPTCQIIAPSAGAVTPTVTFTWTYAHPLLKGQGAFRVKLKTGDGATTLFDSGVITSNLLEYACPFLLQSGSTYMACVQVADPANWSEESCATFTVDLVDAVLYPEVREVGSVYEIAINGVGYMLADHPERDMRYRRRTMPLDPPRLATTDTPFSQAIERYTFVGFSDWASGAGRRIKSERSSAFWDSQGVDPFMPGELSLLNDTVLSLATPYAKAQTCVASEVLFTLTGAKELKSQTVPGGASTTFSVAGATIITDLTSDGEHWYVCDGANIFRSNLSEDPGAAWSTENAQLIKWCSDRIFIASAGSGSVTPNVLTSLTPTGTVEAVRATLPAGTTIRSVTSGDGYVWFAADKFDRSIVWAYKLGTLEAPFVAFELPAGQTCRTVGFYQGNVVIRAREELVLGSRGIVYRCATQDGQLVATRLMEMEDEGLDHGDGAFGGDDRFIAFGWSRMGVDGQTGIGVIDLASGGYAKWLVANDLTANQQVTSIVSWKGRFVFVIAGYGVVAEATVPVPTGWLRTWHTNMASTMTKVFDEFEAIFDPLPNGAGVELAYSVDGGGSYTHLGRADTPGLKASAYESGVTGSTVGLQITLTASAGFTPIVRGALVRLHPLGLADQVVVLPINCAEKVTGLNGAPIPYPTGGVVRARALENLCQTRVLFQDIDWPTTKVAGTWEVVDAVVETGGVFDRTKARRVDSSVVVLTLRRSMK